MNYLGKVFFHPVLRQDNQDYVDGSHFLVQLDQSVISDGSGDQVVFSIHYELRNPSIELLIRSHEAKVVLLVHCVDTMKKFLYEVTSDRNVSLPVGAVIGSVTCQALVVTSARVPFFMPHGANSEFGKSEFSLSEGSPLAVSALHSFSVYPKKLKLFQFLRVQRSEDLHPSTYEFILSSNAITIAMGASAFDYWSFLRNERENSAHLFSSIYKDALVEALKNIIEDETVRDYAWAQRLLSHIEDKSLLDGDRPEFQRINQEICKMLARKGIERYLGHVRTD